MLEVYFRPLYQACIVNPIAKWAKPFSPNAITYIACLTGILVAPLLKFNFLFLATSFLLISGFLDTLDGAVARTRGKITETGIVLDILSDRLVELAIIVGLYTIDPAQRGLSALVMLGSCYLCMTSFLAVGLFTTRDDYIRYHRPGVIERTEAFILFLLMIWMPQYYNYLAGTFSLLLIYLSFSHFKQFITARSEDKSEAEVHLTLKPEVKQTI